jgi:hypothetical protein
MLRACRLLAPLLATLAIAWGSLAAPTPDSAIAREWVEAFKEERRGPFLRIRWFCEDGSVLPPQEPCGAEHGEGIQHGEWSERALALREGGYEIANVLAELEPFDYVGPEPDRFGLSQILIERFLIGWDDGWIFRRARGYRGALQAEDEAAGARAVVLAMLADPGWREPARFHLLRETVRLLPVRGDAASADEVRRLAMRIAERDSGFHDLRVKIHGFPDAGDAHRVREYASDKGRGRLAAEYEELARSIDELYSAGGGGEAAFALAERIADPELRLELEEEARTLQAASSPAEAWTATAAMLGTLRAGFARIDDPALALDVLDLSLSLEGEAYASGSALLQSIDARTRRERLAMLSTSAESLYGVGLLGRRHLSGVRASVERVSKGDPSVGGYRAELRYLARAPEWAGRWIAFDFELAAARLAPLEPLVHLYGQDRLRGSPMLFYSAVIDGLTRDANRVAGISHVLFGEGAGAGLRALNPGLTEGILRTADGSHGEGLESDGIYLLPETTSDLPPVAGILTLGEGSSLSHIQLLARNLGIPNVVVGDELLPRVRQRLGDRVALAVSPGGVVQLDDWSADWEKVFGAEEVAGGPEIAADLEKLDLLSVDLLSLSELRASDSGRTSGPKGANLGELSHHFGERVPPGFVIPFGFFRRLLDRPLEPAGPSVWEWMRTSYAEIAAASSDPREQREKVSRFLARLRDWLVSAELGPELTAKLRTRLEQTFGPDGTYGVFVRSDTNVEDLPGFTGAGLNLTVPNVVGVDAILEAIHRVWASPFTERAYGWRQAHMEAPEYVFPAVVVQLGFPAEKSGVLVTQDVDTGRRDWLSVAVNEGVGGAVDGQASESLRVPLRGGRLLYLAQATAPLRAELDPAGGVVRQHASGTEAVLSQAEVLQLVQLSQDVSRFPSLRDENGNLLAADIEFAFRGGQLALLQIRPFVESRSALKSAHLRRLDAAFQQRGRTRVALDAVPAPPAEDS